MIARLTCFLLVLTAAQTVSADTLTLAWDPSPSTGVSGYIVYVGTQSGVYDRTFDVGSSVSFTYLDASPGQQYYFSVAAYSAGPIVGNRSSEVSGFSNRYPVLANPGSQSGTVGQPTTLQLSGSDPEGRPLNYGATSLPAGLSLVSGTGFISGTPSAAGTFTVTATVTDGALNDAKTFTWVILPTANSSIQPPAPTSPSAPTSPTATSPTPTAPTAPNPTSPSWSFPTAPTTASNLAPSLVSPGSQVANRGAQVLLQLSARDPEGAPITFGATGLPPGLQVSARGEISGTPFVAGNYMVTATATDGTMSDAKTFAWLIIQPSTDGAAPVISITLPTRAPTFISDGRLLTLGGTASDEGRITAVAWSSDRGGQGAATGTENWIAGIALQPGLNVITVRAWDDAGNMASTSLFVMTKGMGTLIKRAPASTKPNPIKGKLW